MIWGTTAVAGAPEAFRPRDSIVPLFRDFAELVLSGRSWLVDGDSTSQWNSWRSRRHRLQAPHHSHPAFAVARVPRSRFSPRGADVVRR